MTVIVHRGGVGEEPLAVSWNASTLGWCDTLDLRHFQSLCSFHEKKKKLSKDLKNQEQM